MPNLNSGKDWSEMDLWGPHQSLGTWCQTVEVDAAGRPSGRSQHRVHTAACRPLRRSWGSAWSTVFRLQATHSPLIGSETVSVLCVERRAGAKSTIIHLLLADPCLRAGGRNVVLRDLALVALKAELEKLLQRAGPAGVGFVASFDDGDALMRVHETESRGGRVKAAGCTYRSGSRPEWVKSKAPTWRQANKDRWKGMQGR